MVTGYASPSARSLPISSEDRTAAPTERSTRIAVVGPGSDRLAEDLRALPLRPEVRAFPSLFAEPLDLQRFRPDVAFVAPGNDAPEEAGALRLLRSLLPGLAMVLVAPADRELQFEPMCQRLGARLLSTPHSHADVAAVLEQALSGSDRPREEVFLDLARGIADEINNPLMYVSGYLQLLQASLDAERDRDRRDQLAYALDGVRRIQDAVERVRLLARASGALRRQDLLNLAVLLEEGIRQAAAGHRVVPCMHEPPGAAFTTRGDPDLLLPGIAAFCRVATELQELGCNVHLALTRMATANRLRLQVSGPAVATWRLPRTFEPYYLSRVLRGTSQGLGLFLAQTVALCHRGQATARRLPDGSLALDLLLPG